MSSYSASAGSCTMHRPPISLTRFIPIEPFAPVPESTTETARAPCDSASARKKMSTGARRTSVLVTSESERRPPLISRLLSGGMT
jgi:hypothetical protein